MLLHILFVLLVIYLIFPRIEIPKIIHQTAPIDTDKWKPEWFECQDTWKKMHPDFEHRLWSDEDIFEFMKKEDPDFYENIFLRYSKPIQRWDAVRPFILYKYGGIYADMDYMCLRRFYELLKDKDKVYIGEFSFSDGTKYENALMISRPNNKFWKLIIEEMKKRGVENENPIETTGPEMFNYVIQNNSELVSRLPKEEYNSMHDPKEAIIKYPEVKTIHIRTCSWCKNKI